jgi:hypothetical protein
MKYHLGNFFRIYFTVLIYGNIIARNVFAYLMPITCILISNSSKETILDYGFYEVTVLNSLLS